MRMSTSGYGLFSGLEAWQLVLLIFGLVIFYKYVIRPLNEAFGERIRAWIVGETNLYNSDEDELEQIVKRIRASKDASQMEEMEAYCLSNPRRLRGWQEYARLLHDVFDDAAAACELYERAVEKIRNKQDKALLLYRAGQLCRDHRKDAKEAERYFRAAAEKYPRTTYGAKSREQVSHMDE